MNNLKKLIKFAREKNAMNFKNTLSDEVSERISSRFDDMKSSLAKTMFAKESVGLTESKYRKLLKKIDNIGFANGSDFDVYNLVVKAFKKDRENPDKATDNEIIDIAGSNGYDIKEEVELTESKYRKLLKKIDNIGFANGSDFDVYNLVVKAFKKDRDNPDKATDDEIIDIAGSNGYDIKEEVKSGDKEAYQKFFDGMLKKFGVDSPEDLDGKKKKEFFDAVDAGWEGDNEED